MSSALYSLGRWAADARRLVVAAWIGVLVVVGGLGGIVFQGFDNSITIPGTESQEALDQLAATFPEVSGVSAQVIVVAPEGGSVKDPDVRTPVESAAGAYGDLDEVVVVSTPTTTSSAPPSATTTAPRSSRSSSTATRSPSATRPRTSCTTSPTSSRRTCRRAPRPPWAASSTPTSCPP